MAVSNVETRVADGAPPGVDGFAQALLLEQRAWSDTLSSAPQAVRERFTPLVAELYTLLRTPIFPKRGYRTIADALMRMAARGEQSVYLYGVLASPTAAVELSRFTQCAALFRRHGFTPQVTLLLVQWENLVEMHPREASVRGRAFAQQAGAVETAARQAGLADAVIPLAVEVDAGSAEIRGPADLRDWSRRVLDALYEPRGADPALVRDVAWSTAFYARQASLSRLGERQALLDLAIRRAIGQRVSAAQAASLHGQESVAAMITSELHKRFLPCYATALPVLNIDARSRAGTAAMAAVA